MLVALLFGVFLFFTFLGVPIAHAMLPAIILTLVVGFDIPLTGLANALVRGVDAWIWLTMPLFLMLGNLMNESGITDRLIDFCQEIVGRIAGGLSHVGVLVNILMAGMSGSCSADAGATGAIMIPVLKEKNYPAGYASALISASSIIGPLIPPSLVLIIVGVIGELSILRLWLGGAVLGFILGLGLVITGYIMARRKGFPRMERRSSFKRVVRTGVVATPALVIPVIILGGMRLGVFTPTEAGAVGVVYVVLLGSLVYRKLDFETFRSSAMRTVALTGPLMWIIAMAILFGTVVGRLNVGPPFVQFLVGISENPTTFLFLISAVVLFLGCIMEGAPIILVLFPFLYPAAAAYGIDPIYFGVLFAYLILVGQCTPPVGPSMFITNAIAGCSVQDYVREGWPLLLTQFFLVPLFIFFPALITWFPNLIMGSLS